MSERSTSELRPAPNYKRATFKVSVILTDLSQMLMLFVCLF